MQWFDSVRTRLRLLLARRAVDSRMNDEFQFHIEMETERLMRTGALAADEARRQALAAFGGVEKHKEALRDGRGLAWLSGMSVDVKLGARMLRKYPGLTLAGGLALAVAIGVGAGWYDLTGKLMSPTIPLPDGDRLVLIETHDTSTNASEPRVARDFLEWRRDLQTIENLGAYRTVTRNLVVGLAAPDPIQMAELTAGAFGAARVPPLFGRGLIDADDVPGAPLVVVLSYDLWQRALGGRPDVLGLVVKLGKTPATVIGVMPEDFGYPVNHDAWTALPLRASYEALEGNAISVIGRLAPGISLEQANAEVRAFGDRTAAAYPATHAHLRPTVVRLGQDAALVDIAEFAARNLPVLLVLIIACTSVGTLVYARTATREGEIAVRAALGAGRARILGQLFVEALVLASVAAAVGLVAANRALTWGIESVNRAAGGAPFWMTPGLHWWTMLYAAGLAIVSAAMLSLLPALKLTRARLQPHLANRGSGGATLRFGRVWTGAMILQVALTAIGIPVAMETASQTVRKRNIRAAFPAREYVAARIDLDRALDDEVAAAFEARRERTFGELQRRVAQEAGVVDVTFADGVPGSATSSRFAEVEASPGAEPAYDDTLRTMTVVPGFFDALDRPIVAGRDFHDGDRRPDARTVIVNEAVARAFARDAHVASPVGARLRYAASAARSAASVSELPHDGQRADTGDAVAYAPGIVPGGRDDGWFEIVGVVRDVGLDPDDEGNELPFVFHAASAGAAAPLAMLVRMRGNRAALAARLPTIAHEVDGRLLLQNAQPLTAWIRERDANLTMSAGALAAVTALVLFLSALGIFSLVSVSVSRRTREIGLRTALGAHPRHVLAGILSRAALLMGGGIAAGGALLLSLLALGAGPSGRPADDVTLFAGYLGVTSAVMLAAALLACVSPARRALGISPSSALKDT
jgi:predicted permease